MKTVAVVALLAAVTLLAGGCQNMSSSIDVEREKAAVTEAIHASIGWAANKDTERLYRCFAHDSDLFYFSPRDDGTVHGFEAFQELTESFFMLDDFKAVRYEIKELVVHLSRSGDVAWYHARLDDYNEWKGQPANWEDVRWTGVLEKRDGRWQIVQMHFSSPTDRS